MSLIFWPIAGVWPELTHWLMGPEGLLENLGKTSILPVIPIVTPLDKSSRAHDLINLNPRKVGIHQDRTVKARV